MKTEDKDFPLLIGQGKKDVISNEVIIIILIFPVLVLIPGIYVMIFSTAFTLGIIMTVISATALLVIVTLIPFIPKRKVYDELVEHAKTRNIDEIKRIATNSTTYIKLGIFALLDLKEFEEAENVVDDLDLKTTSNYGRSYNSGSNYYRVLIKKTKREFEEENLDIKKPRNASKRKIRKVFFFEKLPTGSKCLISSITLDIDQHNILACPNCEGMAKDELFIKWLEEKKKCPMCKHKLVEDDLIMVKRH